MTIESAKMGRPPKEINWTLFEDLCSIQCTQSEIASMLKLHIDTVRDRAEDNYNDIYSNIYKRFSENGKTSLRRLQFKHAQKSFAMAIWLGKQWLGQKDNDTTIVAPPELTQQFNAIMVQIGKSQQEIQDSSLSHDSRDLLTQSDISPNNSLHPVN